ncbi:MAG: hypothetical protein HGA75_08660, partial [Thiobacillus sp.]|nr:hypothetical protein [Thiobacillus sp.]
LWRVHESPLITVPVYMVFALDRDDERLAEAVRQLRRMGAEERAYG